MKTFLLFLLTCLAASAQVFLSGNSLISGNVMLGSYTAAAVAAPTPDILWWQMTNGSGTTVTASVGANGSFDGPWVASGNDYALNFDATSRALTVSAVTPSTNCVTICVWVSLRNTNTTMIIAESSVQYWSTTDAWDISVQPTGELYIGSTGTTGERSEYYPGIPTSTWTHLAAVIDHKTATGDCKLYVNGSEVTANSINPNTKSGTANFASQVIYVGARNSSTLRLDALLDDFRVYSGELSAAQIQAIYNQVR